MNLSNQFFEFTLQVSLKLGAKLVQLKASRYFYIAGILMILVGLIINGLFHGADFQVFYVSGQRFLKHLPIYQMADGWSPFKYHPAWSVFFSVWSLIPLKLANLLFNLLNLVFWITAARQWANWLGYQINLKSFFILLLLSLNPLSAEMAYVQVNGFLFWGSTQIFKMMEEDRDQYLKSGILLAILCSLKLNFGILLFYLLIKNFKSAFGFVLGLFLLHAVVAISFHDIYAVETYQAWIQLLFNQSSDQLNTFEVQGLLRFCANVFSDTYSQALWFVALVFSVMYGFYIERLVRIHKTGTDRQKLILNGCFWMSAIFFFSPLTWWYHILYLYPTLFTLLKARINLATTIFIWASCLFISFVSFNTVGRDAIYILKEYLAYFFVAALLFITFNIYARKIIDNYKRPITDSSSS